MLVFIKALVRRSLDVAAAWLGDHTARFYSVLITHHDGK